LVIQDVLTIHGSQLKGADLIVASPPCQAYSYMAMPWSRAKQIAREYEDGTRDVKQLTALFDACFRIQREAIEAAGHHIPLVVENVRGAQRWVGRSRWNFGSFHLWGDVPALMPMVSTRANKMPTGDGVRTDKGRSAALANYDALRADLGVKVPTMGAGWYPPGHPKHVKGLAFNGHAERFASRDGSGTKQHGSGREWFSGEGTFGRLSSKSPARKAASALIAKIPLTLSRHIARAWHPREAA
jgi:hypothetical protein